MKHNVPSLLSVVCALLLATTPVAHAGSNIICGNNQSGFILSGGNLAVAGGAALKLESGYLRQESGTISSDITLDKTIIEKVSGGFVGSVTGTLKSDSSISLGDGQRLLLQEGVTPGAIATSGTTTIEGYGSLGGAITVAAAGTLQLDVSSTINQNITLADSSAQVVLKHDLEFIGGKQFLVGDSSSPTINGAGYEIIFSGSDTLTFDEKLTFAGEDTKISLKNSAVLSQSWTINNNVFLDGGGHVFDISNTTNAFSIAAGKELTLSNIALKGWGTGTISFADKDATLNLHNVTIVMDDSVQLTLGKVRVEGDTIVITYTHLLQFGSVDETNYAELIVDGKTLYFDRLAAAGTDNIRALNDGLITLLNNGRIKLVDANDDGGVDGIETGVLTFDPDHAGMHVTGMNETKFLYPDTDDTDGLQMRFTGGDFTFDGQGRRIYFAHIYGSGSTTLFTVDGSTAVKLTNVYLEGLQDAHIALDALTDSITFGGNTVIRLHEDDALTQTYRLGGDAGQTVVVDLNGHSLDLADASAQLSILDAAGSTVSFRNGKIKNLSATKLATVGTATTVEFRNVELVLSGNTQFTQGALTFIGDCSIDALGAFTFHNSATQNITLAQEAKLTLHRTVTYQHSGGTINFVFTDASSILALDGARFKTTGSGDNVILKKGTIALVEPSVFDGNVTFITGLEKVTTNLYAGATLTIENGTLSTQ